MVRPALRTRSRKKVKKKLPGGKTVTHFREGKAGNRTCGRCQAVLGGTLAATKSEMQKHSKSEKVPERPYAGVLCPDCTEKLLMYETRLKVKSKYPEYADLEISRDLTLERYLPKGWYASLSKK